MIKAMKQLQELYPELVEVSTIEKEYDVRSQLQCGSKNY